MPNKLGLAEARLVVEAILKAAADRGLEFAGAVVDSGGGRSTSPARMAPARSTPECR